MVQQCGGLLLCTSECFVMLELCMDRWLKGQGNFDRYCADLKIFPTMVKDKGKGHSIGAF
jgi:hypothetical protein